MARPPSRHRRHLKNKDRVQRYEPKGFCSSQVDNFYGFCEPLVAGEWVDTSVLGPTFLPATPTRISLRTFVHVSHRCVSHGDFSNFSFSGLLRWAESHKKTRGSSKPRYRNLVNEKARCACNPVIPSMPVSNGPPTGSLRQVPVEFRNLRHRCARDTCGAGRHPSNGVSLPGARPRSWLAE